MEAQTDKSAAGTSNSGSSRRESQAPGSARAPNLAEPKKTKKANNLDGRQGQNQGETTGESSLTFSGQGSTDGQRLRSSAKSRPSVEQQDESRAQLVVDQESGPQLRALDLSSMSIGSGIRDIYTLAMTYPDATKPRAPEGVYRLGNSVVSIVTTPRPTASTTEDEILGRRELDKERQTQLERALVEQQEEIWKMRARNEAQMVGVTRQMEALTVRAESRAVVMERVTARMGRVQATGAAEREAMIAQDRIIASLSAEVQGPSTAPRRRPSLVAQPSTSAARPPVQPQLPPTVVPSASSNSTDSLIPHGKNKWEKKNKKPEGKTQSTTQTAPPKPKVNKHESSKFRSQNLANLTLRAPGLIRPPALMTPIEPRPVGVGMLQSLGAFVHPLAQLRAYGYTTSNPTAEEIQAALAKPHENAICKRCEKPFVYKDISWDKISEDDCVHHPGKCSIVVNGKKLANGKPMKVWSCCYKRGFAPGCTTGTTHVLEMEDAGRLADLCPFRATPSPASSVDNVTKIQKIIALDCEMSYTKHGLALSRMSVLSFPDCRVLEDTFIRDPYPSVRFLDYNTRYSGVTHESLYPDDPENNPPVLEGITAARSKLWEYCDENTIIIGHGLDHDLKCLRMLHPKIIDTAILFSKVEGQKFGLKKLAEVELKWSIQEDVGETTGHDSVEDCRTCIELVLKYLQRPAVAVESAASEIPD